MANPTDTGRPALTFVDVSEIKHTLAGILKELQRIAAAIEKQGKK